MITLADKVACIERQIEQAWPSDRAWDRDVLEAVLADLRTWGGYKPEEVWPSARRAGAEEMRERAAQIVAASAHDWDISRASPERLAGAIRALPVE